MSTLTALRLNNNTAETHEVEPDGPVIAVTRLDTRSRIPAELSALFAAVHEPAQLVTVRRIGVPEQSDGSHLQHFLVPADIILKPTTGLAL